MKALLLVNILMFLTLISLKLGATTYRGSTYTEVHNIIVDPSVPDGTAPTWSWINLPAVICLPEDTLNDCSNSTLRNDLLLWANGTYMLPASSSWAPVWDSRGVGLFKLALHSVDSDDIRMV